jgi:hypothetical protein
MWVLVFVFQSDVSTVTTMVVLAGGALAGAHRWMTAEERRHRRRHRR